MTFQSKARTYLRKNRDKWLWQEEENAVLAFAKELDEEVKARSLEDIEQEIANLKREKVQTQYNLAVKKQSRGASER